MLDKRLMLEIKGNKTYYAVMLMNGLLSLLFSYLTAFFIANIINDIFIRRTSFYKQYLLFAGFLALLLIKTIVTFFFHRYFRRFAHGKKNEILLKSVEDLLRRGPVTSRGDASGGIITSWCDASDQIEPFYSQYLPQFFVLAVTVPLFLCISLYYDGVSALIMLVTGPLLPFFMSLIGRQSKEANQKRLAGLSRLGDSMLDLLNGIRTLKLYHGIQSYRQLIVRQSEEFRRLTMEVLRIAFLSSFVLELAATISTAMIAVSLGIRLLQGTILFYPAFFILLLTPDYYMGIRKFGARFHTAMGAKAAADSLYQYRDHQEETEARILYQHPDHQVETKAGIKDQYPVNQVCQGSEEEKLLLIPNQPVTITVEHLFFHYPNSNNQVLKDLSLRVESGRVTAIIGKSGAGKSTLSYALMKFINYEGSVYFNHIDVSRVKPESLRSMIAYLPQKPYLFHDTLRNNLLMARQNATEEELIEALEKAALTDFVRSLPQGMDTKIFETGANISVGEAQRLAFARAYLKNCPVILMDESTSALDAENERLIREGFQALARNKTVIVIAHRLETVKHADIIYVLEDGSMKEAGTHEELLSVPGRYRQLVEAGVVT